MGRARKRPALTGKEGNMAAIQGVFRVPSLYFGSHREQGEVFEIVGDVRNGVNERCLRLRYFDRLKPNAPVLTCGVCGKKFSNVVSPSGVIELSADRALQMHGDAHHVERFDVVGDEMQVDDETAAYAAKLDRELGIAHADPSEQARAAMEAEQLGAQQERVVRDFPLDLEKASGVRGVNPDTPIEISTKPATAPKKKGK